MSANFDLVGVSVFLGITLVLLNMITMVVLSRKTNEELQIGLVNMRVAIARLESSVVELKRYGPGHVEKEILQMENHPRWAKQKETSHPRTDLGKIKRLVEKTGTQHGAALEIGCSPIVVSKMLRGKQSHINKSTRKKLNAAYDRHFK